MAELHKHSVDNVGSRERDMTTVEVTDFDIDSDEERLPLTQFIADLQEALESIPPKHRDTAVLSIRGYGDYVSIQADIQFKRPETDEELADRLRWLDGLDDETERRDRGEFERLKHKFG